MSHWTASFLSNHNIRMLLEGRISHECSSSDLNFKIQEAFCMNFLSSSFYVTFLCLVSVYICRSIRDFTVLNLRLYFRPLRIYKVCPFRSLLPEEQNNPFPRQYTLIVFIPSQFSKGCCGGR